MIFLKYSIVCSLGISYMQQSILITLNPLIHPLQFLRDTLLHPLPCFMSFIIILINPVSTMSTGHSFYTVQFCQDIFGYV